MTTATHILITFALAWHIGRSLVNVISFGTVSVLADASPRATKHSRDKMNRETGKAAWRFVLSAAFNSTLIIALWVWS